MLMPLEEERDEFGLGHLPLLMVMGFVPVLPDHDDFERELVGFLCTVLWIRHLLEQRQVGKFYCDQLAPLGWLIV